MKKTWTAPELEQLNVTDTEYSQIETENTDAYIYDTDTGEVTSIVGYQTSGFAAN